MINNIYENEKWLGNVVNKKVNQICVHCLEKPHGVYVAQNLERERKMQFSLNRCSILMVHQFYPKLMQMVKKDINGFGVTNCH